jgi:hypothetical protein
MTAETPARPKHPLLRMRWLPCLALGLIGTYLTIAVLEPDRLPEFEFDLFPKAKGYGYSLEDFRLLAEIKALGGDARIMQRKARFLGRFGSPDLISVSFHERAFDDDALARFVRAYRDRVFGLRLNNTGVTDAGLRHLAGLPHLIHLGITDIDTGESPPNAARPLSKITDAGLVHLQGLTNLGGLRLDGLPVTDAGLVALKDLPNLGVLYLNRTQVHGAAFARLKSLPGLAVLYLDGSAVTDEGLGHLKGATSLESLSLAGVPLTSRSLVHLEDIPKLIRLDVKGCGLSPQDIANLQLGCPLLKLE